MKAHREELDALIEAEAFSHRVAHDLSGTLQNIRAYAKRAIRKKDDPEALERYLERILECTGISLEIIKGLYELSGLSRQELVTTMAPLDDTLQASLKILAIKIQESGATIEVDCPHSVEHSHDQLILVFQNLIGNALKFSTHHVHHPRVNIHSRLIKNQVVVSIEDNGPGVPETARPKIFQAFERLHGEEVPGLGIGLSIVAKVLKSHKAVIEVSTSETLGGAAFHIAFPPSKGDSV